MGWEKGGTQILRGWEKGGTQILGNSRESAPSIKVLIEMDS